MTSVEEILAGAGAFLVVDWPTREVPDALARAGYDVVARGGPGPEDYTSYQVVGGKVVERRVGAPPAHVDVVYMFRPLDTLPEIPDMATQLGAGAVWVQSGGPTTVGRTPRGAGSRPTRPPAPGPSSRAPGWPTSTGPSSPVVRARG